MQRSLQILSACTEWWRDLIRDAEVDVRECSVKKVFLKTSQTSRENSCTRVSFLINLQNTKLHLFCRTPMVAAFGFNEQAIWYVYFEQYLYQILTQLFARFKREKSIGRNRLVGKCYKQLQFYRKSLTFFFFQQILEVKQKLSKWLIIPLLSYCQNKDTHIARTCLNIAFKIFAICLNMFLTDLFQSCNIVVSDQIGSNQCSGNNWTVTS